MMAINQLYLKILIFLVASMTISPSLASTETTEIVVNASYSVNSPWTEDEIRQRFQKIDRLFSSGCSGLKIVLGEVLPIHDPELQDIDGSLSSKGVLQIEKLLAKFTTNRRPTIIYTRNGMAPGYTEMSSDLAKAFSLGGPRYLRQFSEYEWNDLNIFDGSSKTQFHRGNLPWERYSELRLLHGVSLIAQSSSYNYDEDRIFGLNPDKYQSDAHELGHILTNDGSHRVEENNLMSGWSSDDRHIIDFYQCALMKAFPALEKVRDLAVKEGMATVCKIERDYGFTLPNYCTPKK